MDVKKMDTKIQKSLIKNFRKTRKQLSIKVIIFEDGIEKKNLISEEILVEIANRVVDTLLNNSDSRNVGKIEHLRNKLEISGAKILSKIEINIWKHKKVNKCMVEFSDHEGSIEIRGISDDPDFPITLPLNNRQLDEILGDRLISDEGKQTWALLEKNV